jgi:hypothetical protein
MDTFLKIKQDPRLKDKILDLSIPKPFYIDLSKVKGIIIGADPSNFSNHGITRELDTVFGLEDINSQYFRSIIKNLKEVGLDFSDIYVQNLVYNYCNKVTDKNPFWYDFAKYWKPELKDELDGFFPHDIPVFITSNKVFCTLTKEFGIKRPKNYYDYYDNGTILKENSNYLSRKLIPFFRYTKYNLSNSNWPNQIKAIKKLVNT